MTNADEFYYSILESNRNQAKLAERLAIMEILIEEIKYANTPAELEALERVAAQIKHRTTQGL